MSEVDESEAESDDATPARRCATTAQWMEPPTTSFLVARETTIDLAQEQADDPDLGQAISWVTTGKGPDKLNIRRLTRQGRAYWGLFNSDLLGYPTIRPLSFRPRSFRPGHFVPWSFRPRSFRPRSFCPLVISSPGHFVPSCHIIQINSTCVK
jgi:hypothetical protein